MQRSHTKKLSVLIAAVLALALFFPSCAYETGGDASAQDGDVPGEGTGSGASEGLLSIEDEPLPQSDGSSMQDSDSVYDTGYDENRAYDSLLYTDDDFVYAYGKAGLYRFRRGSNAAGELVFPCEPGTIYDFAVTGGSVYYTGAIGTESADVMDAEDVAAPPPAASMNIANAAMFRYDIAREESFILEESIRTGFLSLRGGMLYRTYIEPSVAEDLTETWKYVDAIYQFNADDTVTEVVTDPNPPEGRFYTTQGVNERTEALFSENADGTDRIRLALIVKDVGYAVANNRIFYWQEDILTVDDEEVVSKELCAVNPDGSDAKPLSQDVSGWDGLYADTDWRTVRILNYDDEHIYLVRSEKSGWQSDYKYFRMTYDGKDRTDYEALSHSGAAPMSLHPADNWIYYTRPGETTLHRISADGIGDPQTEPFTE